MKWAIRFVSCLLPALLFSAEVRAAIVHLTIPPEEQEFLGLGPQVSRDFDFDQDGRNDVRFVTGAAGFAVQSLHLEAGITSGSMRGNGFLGLTAVPLLYGMEIVGYRDLFPLASLELYPGIAIDYGYGTGASTANIYLLSYGALDGGSGGIWHGRDAYLGFALYEPLVIGEFAKHHFGWLHIREFGGFGGYFLEYAYETEADKPILAGQIPESGTLALVALSALGLARQRKKAGGRAAMILRLLMAMALLTTAAPAAIVHGIVPESQRLFVQGPLPFDFDQDGTADLTFIATSATFQFLSVQPSTDGLIFVQSQFGAEPAAVIGAGIEISASNLQGSPIKGGDWGQGAQISAFYDNGNGPVLEGPWVRKSGYLGFSFGRGIGHYGWFRMEELGGYLALYEWAYETEDLKPIFAGQIPEPGSLALVGLSALGQALRRRRREAGLP